jgi:hypothetical protein
MCWQPNYRPELASQVAIGGLTVTTHAASWAPNSATTAWPAAANPIRAPPQPAGNTGHGFLEGMFPGSEVAGVVTATGEGVDGVWIGRRVWAFTGTGSGYVEEAIARFDDVVELPGGLSTAGAVPLGSAAPVAHFGYERAHLRAGETVLVRGAAASIGSAAVELAARAGAGAVGRHDLVPRTREAGPLTWGDARARPLGRWRRAGSGRVRRDHRHRRRA